MNFYAAGKAILSEGMTIGQWWLKPQSEWPSTKRAFGLAAMKRSFDGSETPEAQTFVNEES